MFNTKHRCLSHFVPFSSKRNPVDWLKFNSKTITFFASLYLCTVYCHFLQYLELQFPLEPSNPTKVVICFIHIKQLNARVPSVSCRGTLSFFLSHIYILTYPRHHSLIPARCATSSAWLTPAAIATTTSLSPVASPKPATTWQCLLANRTQTFRILPLPGEWARAWAPAPRQLPPLLLSQP